MELIVAYTDKDFINQLKSLIKIPIEAYSENIYSEKKKALALKGSWGARKSPFALLKDNGTNLKAFYSEDSSCTVENILKCIQKY